MFASASVSTGNAQAASCANTTLTWPAESGGTLAFADAGPGNVISFVCIESTEFAGGEGGPFTADGWVADGCFIIDGLGTDVVAVFRELPDINPGCDQIISISAGLQGAATTPTPGALTPTPTTAPPTATSPASTATAVATATATRTATTPPVATATVTATTPPMATSTMPPASTATVVPPTSVATSPAATATPTRPVVLPPNTGGGTSGGSGGSATLFASIAIMMVAAGAGALFVSRKTERNRS